MAGFRGMSRLPRDTVRARRNASRLASDADTLFGDGLTLGGDGILVIDLAATNPGLQFVSGGLAALVQGVLAIDASGIKVTIGTGLQNVAGTLKTKDSEIVHDNLNGFVANEHIDHSTISITAGTGLSGGGDITASRTLTFAPSYGSMYVYDGSEVISIDTLGEKYEITSGFTAGLLNGVTFQNSHNLKVSVAGKYRIVWQLSIDTPSAADRVEGGIMINGVAQNIGAARTTVTSSESSDNMSAMAILSLSVDDEISLYVANNSNDDDITIKIGNMIIMWVGV